MTLKRASIIASGSYLPEKSMTNDELAHLVDTSDEWIKQRTGITSRHVAAEGELTSDLATHAARDAIKKAGINTDEIDLIIVATTTPDQTFPATAAKVQKNLNVKKGFAYDVQAVCSGFIYALSLADNHLRLGQARCALVIGAETMSRILDWKDRTTCVLFGDGAGAVILKANELKNENDAGILSCTLHSDGVGGYDHLYVDGGVSSTKTAGHIQMHGKEVFKHAVENLASVVDEILATNNMTYADVDWLVPHQANKRIIDMTAKKLGLSKDKVVLTIEHHGNTSAASVPLALAHAMNQNHIKPGEIVLMEAMGAGFTWGASLVRM